MPLTAMMKAHQRPCRTSAAVLECFRWSSPISVARDVTSLRCGVYSCRQHFQLDIEIFVEDTVYFVSKYLFTRLLLTQLLEYSGKFAVLDRLLHYLRENTNDRIVLVSNYTQTLDLMAALCRSRPYPYLRLDGSCSVSKRTKLVAAINDFSRCATRFHCVCFVRIVTF